MMPLRTIALVFALGAGAFLYPLVAPSAPPGGVETARHALEAGDYTNAITIYTNVLQTERLDTTLLATVYQERGVARHKSGSATTAIADYTNSIWLGVLPDALLARSFLDRGIAYVEVGELIRAGRDFDNAIAKDPHLADAYFGRATVNRLLGKPQEALSDYDEAIRLGHEQPSLVFFGRGLAYEMLGDIGRAVPDYREAALRAPSSTAVKAKLAALGAAPPPESEIQAFALNASRKLPDRGAPVPPASSIALADAGEILTLASNAEPTGALPPASGPPVMLRSAQSPNLSPSSQPSAADTASAPSAMPGSAPSPAARPAFLRPARDALLAEQAVAANLRAGGADTATTAQDAADASAPTGALPPGPVTTEPPAAAPTQAEPVKEPEAAPPAAPAPPPKPEQTAALAPAPVPATAPVSAPAKSGGFFVQLGAYADKSVADHGASGFKSRFPQVSAGASVEQAVIAGRGTMYRVRVGPLASEAESRALCDSLRRSAQPCVPVIPRKGLR